MPEFDHHSSAFAENWRGQYRELRGSCPVARVDSHGGFTLLTRYADIREVLRDPRSPRKQALSRDLRRRRW